MTAMTRTADGTATVVLTIMAAGRTVTTAALTEMVVPSTAASSARSPVRFGLRTSAPKATSVLSAMTLQTWSRLIIRLPDCMVVG